MTADPPPGDMTDLVDGLPAGPEWDAWLAAHPDAALEIAVARRVRLLLGELGAEAVTLPADFEARLLARLQQDATLLGLLDLGLVKGGRALLELLDLFFALLPAPRGGPRPAGA